VPRKTRALDQIRAMQDKAVRFLRDVTGDPEQAEESAAISPEVCWPCIGPSRGSADAASLVYRFLARDEYRSARRCGRRGEQTVAALVAASVIERMSRAPFDIYSHLFPGRGKEASDRYERAMENARAKSEAVVSNPLAMDKEGKPKGATTN
jgi:hypothetical protein